jgi:hypothetical protein
MVMRQSDPQERCLSLGCIGPHQGWQQVESRSLYPDDRPQQATDVRRVIADPKLTLDYLCDTLCGPEIPTKPVCFCSAG